MCATPPWSGLRVYLIFKHDESMIEVQSLKFPSAFEQEETRSSGDTPGAVAETQDKRANFC